MINDPFDKDAWVLRALAAGHISVSGDGRIMRKPAASPMRWYMVEQQFATHARSGRVYFQMTFEGITKSVLVNRVVALALHPNPKGLAQVNHIDGDKANNHPSNLEWASRSDNERHAQQTGLKTGRGSQNANAKLNARIVEAIRASDRTPADLAAIYGVSVKAIRDVISRKTWSHI